MSIAEKHYLSTSEVGAIAEADRDTVWAWIRHGVRSVYGETVRLEADRIGGRWRISREAWEQFKTRCAGRDIQTPAEKDRQDKAESAAHKRLCKKLGIKP